MKHLGLVFDPRFKLHDTGHGHPERPARMDAVISGLEREGLVSASQTIDVSPVDPALLLKIHTQAYLERLERACADGAPYIDTPDSAICPASLEIASLAAGGVVQAARCIARGDLRRAFCAVRPPGHHAERDHSMGFCLYANASLATNVLLEEAGLERVLILDWDVHHGNGTQHIFEEEPRVLFVSLHGHPDYLYPGTGYRHEIGTGRGEGHTINLPFLPGAIDDEYRDAFELMVEPAVTRFEPQAIVISAGFDAHRDDPIGCARLSDDIFSWMTRRVVDWSERHSSGRILSLLEGGYDLDALRRNVAEHVRLLEEE